MTELSGSSPVGHGPGRPPTRSPTGTPAPLPLHTSPHTSLHPSHRTVSAPTPIRPLLPHAYPHPPAQPPYPQLFPHSLHTHTLHTPYALHTSTHTPLHSDSPTRICTVLAHLHTPTNSRGPTLLSTSTAARVTISGSYLKQQIVLESP